MTPLVRKLAAENGVDLGSVKGTGVGGRIRKQDVLAAAEAAKAAAAAPAPAPAAAAAAAAKKAPALEASPLRGQTVKMTRIRKVIGDNMMKALHEQAQLSSVVEVDITRLMKLRAQAKDSFAAREGVKLSPMPFFVKAAAQALKAHPVVNARINEDEGTITYFDTENIGIAVDSEKGLMTPVIKHAGDLNIAGIAKATAELAGKVRANKITPDELSGATFTISNTGSRGALFDTIIVPPNQVAILGIGATVKRPAVIETGGGHGHRRPRHDVPDPLLRPPSGGRRRRGPLPDGGQGDPGGGRVRGRARPVTSRLRCTCTRRPVRILRAGHRRIPVARAVACARSGL